MDSNNIKLGTNYISNTHSVSIPIQCNVGNLAQGNYFLEFENSEEFMIGSCLELEDLHTGIITNLRNDTIYNFMSDTNSQSPRFILHIERSFNIDVINPTCSNDSSGKIYISSNENHTCNSKKSFILWMERYNNKKKVVPRSEGSILSFNP